MMYSGLDLSAITEPGLAVCGDVTVTNSGTNPQPVTVTGTLAGDLEPHSEGSYTDDIWSAPAGDMVPAGGFVEYLTCVRITDDAEGGAASLDIVVERTE